MTRPNFPRLDEIDATGSDVAGQESAHETVRDSRARLRDFAEASSDWFWETGPDGEITYMAYRNGPDISGSDTSRLMLSRKAGGDPEDVARDPARWERLWNDLDAHRPFRNFEFPVRSNDGEMRFIRASGKPMFDERGTFAGYRGVGTDVTEAVESQRQLEHYQDRLRRLASEVSLAEERERHRIAAELHDGALQDLALARIQLDSLRTKLSGSDESTLAEAIRDLLIRSIRETRTLMSELSPPMLYELGLERALEWLVERFEERYGLACKLTKRSDLPALAHDVRVLLFQAVRELLANVVKHSGGTRASIVVQRQADALIIEVRDNGIGFRVEASEVRPSDSGGFGLFSLRERLELLGGWLRMDSDNGGRVVICVPVECSDTSTT